MWETMWAAMLLSALSGVICYVQASVAFFAGHACCYCSWNRASHVEHYQELQSTLLSVVGLCHKVMFFQILCNGEVMVLDQTTLNSISAVLARPFLSNGAVCN